MNDESCQAEDGNQAQEPRKGWANQRKDFSFHREDTCCQSDWRYVELLASTSTGLWLNNRAYQHDPRDSSVVLCQLVSPPSELDSLQIEANLLTVHQTGLCVELKLSVSHVKSTNMQTEL